MSSFLVSFGLLTAMFAAVAALERVPSLQHTPSPLRRPWFHTDLVWYLVAALAAGLTTFLLRPVLVRLALPGLADVVGSMPTWLALVVGVVVFDGVFFVIHRSLHRSETLWRFHKVHHSSRR